MSDPGLLAQRLRWARLEQGLTLQQLSERTSRAVSYLSQLEHGVRTNPTKQTVDVLAEALGVRSAFLFGEEGDLRQAGQRFMAHLRAMSPAEREELTYAPPERRFQAVVQFLVAHLPEHVTHLELNWQLGLSARQYHDLLHLRHEVSHPLLERLSNLAGIPLSFLVTGQPAPPSRSTAELRADYEAAIRAAIERNVSPDRLLALIQTAET